MVRISAYLFGAVKVFRGWTGKLSHERVADGFMWVPAWAPTYMTVECGCGVVNTYRELPPQVTADDVTCQHGTAMDVHCCHCHSGFIFDPDHECPPRETFTIPYGVYRPGPNGPELVPGSKPEGVD